MKFLGKSSVKLNDGTVWPRPGGDEEWSARYGRPDPLVLASFVCAYEALILLPERRRNEVIRALRIAWHRRDANGDLVTMEKP